MNRDVLATLWVLGFGVALGVKLCQWLESQRQPAVLIPYNPEPHRLAQVQCRCADCAPPFYQESPSEVQ